MSNIDKIEKEITDIDERINEIIKFVNIYNIEDEESINSIKLELNEHLINLDKIKNEKLKRRNK